MKKALNLALLISFVITVLEPLTGIHLHKLASLLFLALCIVHTLLFRKRSGVKKYLLLALVVLSFLTGLLGLILEQYPLLLILHRALSIGAVFFLAIHIFVYSRKLR